MIPGQVCLDFFAALYAAGASGAVPLRRKLSLRPADLPFMPELPDATLSGHDPTPGIVSVHATMNGQALVWRRTPDGVILERDSFRPWVYARNLDDLQHLGEQLSVDDAAAPLSVETLQGPPGSYRYLLTARDGRTLHQAILYGSRLRRAPASRIQDLGYIAPGVTEQYLMASGRTYFKGLQYDDLHRLQFDLETTSLTPDTGRIFMIAVRDTRGLRTLLEARRPAQEADMIRSLVQLIRERDPDVIENHNIHRFDLPFLHYRAQVHGIPLNFGRTGGTPEIWQVSDGSRQQWLCSGREIMDTLDAVRRLGLPSAGLKAAAQHFGLAPEGRVYLEGSAIVDTYRDDPNTVRRYAHQDVEEVDALSRKVLASSFALARMAPRPFHRLPTAGPATGVLEPMLIRAYLRARAALPARESAVEEPHRGGAVHLFVEGVINHVVKADVASMYPSLIRSERIGPARDHLGVFLHLMDRLTALRLEHKAAARRGESGEHDAMQSAMKLIVNAGYGYLGAGRLSLFADRAAADRVTKRGREVLATVLRGLKQRGVTLIEADTDGVYFATPSAWSEHEARALISEVSGLLPAGVTLEFDGRAQAMLSHEVKNYALLRYDGTLDVSGAAFESSRSEEYGRGFLQRALTYLLKGDVAGVHRTFQDTMTALETRQFRNEDVARRVRMTKSMEAYRLSREARKDSVYEALLASGYSWQVGDRIRVYHRSAQGLRVLENPLDCDYDIRHYTGQLLTGYASRLRKAFRPEEFTQVFPQGHQPGLFDLPLHAIHTIWRPVVAPEVVLGEPDPDFNPKQGR